MLSGKNVAFYVSLALFIAAVSAGIILMIKSSGSGSPGIEILLPTATSTPELRVHVSGAVAVPGVYALKEGDRLVDAIDAAGGASEGALLSCINLAARVEDEDHFHVPGPAESCQGTPSVPTTGENVRIDLNTATVELLQTLPNIGEARARAITAFRAMVPSSLWRRLRTCPISAPLSTRASGTWCRACPNKLGGMRNWKG